MDEFFLDPIKHTNTKKVIRRVIGLRIEFSTYDDHGIERRSWFHEFSDDFRPKGYWYVIGRRINEPLEYKESSVRSLMMLDGPEEEENDKASIQYFKPRLVLESVSRFVLSLAKRLRYRLSSGRDPDIYFS